jgi:hypothetical protein
MFNVGCLFFTDLFPPVNAPVTRRVMYALVLNPMALEDVVVEKNLADVIDGFGSPAIAIS